MSMSRISSKGVPPKFVKVWEDFWAAVEEGEVLDPETDLVSLVYLTLGLFSQKYTFDSAITLSDWATFANNCENIARLNARPRVAAPRATDDDAAWTLATVKASVC